MVAMNLRRGLAAVAVASMIFGLVVFFYSSRGHPLWTNEPEFLVVFLIYGLLASLVFWLFGHGSKH
jgi:membrane protease YdiL (CAAX protease family)